MALVGTLCALTVWGCDHTYIYRPDNMPDVSGGTLLVPDPASGELEPFEIETIKVARTAHTGVFAEPTAAELEALAQHRRDGTDLEAVELKVATGRKVWQDYALVGVGIAALVGAAAGFTISGLDNGGSARLDLSERMAISGLIAFGFSFYGVGIGAGIGAAATSGVTDHRLDP